LLALKELEEQDGLTFNLTYERQPFFLRGSQQNIDRWMAELGLPKDAPRGEVMKKMGWDRPGAGIDLAFEQAGIKRNMETVNAVQYSDTMNSHRLAWYAGSVDREKGERMWQALSRRYFEGKDTEIRPIRLDNRAMLLECAEEVGLDTKEAERVLDSDLYRKEIVEVVEAMREFGINSIPVFCFEVDGIAQGSWLENPKSRGRMFHHGSGSAVDFYRVFQQLHNSCQANI
jgi:predicted DsbA family dithiol-disulfide isomerase